jgi:hypothetical protein
MVMVAEGGWGFQWKARPTRAVTRTRASHAFHLLHADWRQTSKAGICCSIDNNKIFFFHHTPTLANALLFSTRLARDFAGYVMMSYRNMTGDIKDGRKGQTKWWHSPKPRPASSRLSMIRAILGGSKKNHASSYHCCSIRREIHGYPCVDCGYSSREDYITTTTDRRQQRKQEGSVGCTTDRDKQPLRACPRDMVSNTCASLQQVDTELTWRSQSACIRSGTRTLNRQCKQGWPQHPRCASVSEKCNDGQPR